MQPRDDRLSSAQWAHLAAQSVTQVRPLYLAKPFVVAGFPTSVTMPFDPLVVQEDGYYRMTIPPRQETEQ